MSLTIVSETTPSGVQRVPWGDFDAHFRFKQSEHATLIGPTGRGKTTLAQHIVRHRRYVTVFASKPRDEAMGRFVREGYVRMRTWQPEVANRIVFAPRIDPDRMEVQQQAFSNVISRIFLQGGWCALWDEATYLSRDLGLERKMSMLWQQGRSDNISIVACTQRPAFLPLFAYDGATHIFFWKMKLDRDMQRVAGMAGLDIRTISDALRNLDTYETLYVNRDTDSLIITKPEITYG